MACGWVYFCAIVDRASREVLAYRVSTTGVFESARPPLTTRVRVMRTRKPTQSPVDPIVPATLRVPMRRRFIHRLTTTLFVVLSLLFSQLALANYVCPGQGDTAGLAETMAAGEPCEGLDPAQPVLCHQHSAGAAQSFEAVKLPVASLPMVVQVLLLPLVLEAVEAEALPAASAPEARPPPDPVFLSTLRLRV